MPIMNRIALLLKGAKFRIFKPVPGGSDMPAQNDPRTQSAGTMVARQLEQAMKIPFLDETRDDVACHAAHKYGLNLARQERWEDLLRDIECADMARETSPAGVPLADLYALGARSDVVLAVEHALENGRPDQNAPLLDGIMALEAVRTETAASPYLDLIVAMAHIDIGWAWRGNCFEASVPETHKTRCAAHFERATRLLAPHLEGEVTSPAMAAARCALLAGRADPAARISDDYEALIDLDPRNHRHLRAFGNQLLPRWFGSYDKLELEARRTAARTRAVWGSGGYTWVNLDAIATDDTACARLDVAFFTEGLRDIVATDPGQCVINFLAAYCAVTLRDRLGSDTGADLVRIQIAECARWLIRDHLTEIHPLTWAHAADGFDENARGTSARRFAAKGRDDARRVLAELFGDEAVTGMVLPFTATSADPV